MYLKIHWTWAKCKYRTYNLCDPPSLLRCFFFALLLYIEVNTCWAMIDMKTWFHYHFLCPRRWAYSDRTVNLSVRLSEIPSHFAFRFRKMVITFDHSNLIFGMELHILSGERSSFKVKKKKKKNQSGAVGGIVFLTNTSLVSFNKKKYFTTSLAEKKLCNTL